MRIFKPTYSKSLPEGAKVFVCKRGKDEGKKFARFKDSKSHVTQARLTKSGDKILIETSHWHIEFEDNNGIRRRLKVYTNEAATKKLADRIEDLLHFKANNQQPTIELQKWLEQVPVKIRSELVGFRLLDLNLVSKKLAEHIEDFKECLEKKERSSRHISETVAILNRLFDLCGFENCTDIAANKIKEVLDELRDGGNGFSKRTYNHYLKTAKQFCKYLTRQGCSISSIEYLEGLENEQTDRRHIRRAATDNELRLLLDTTAKNGKRYGMGGYERKLLYWFAVSSGLRANEIRTLKISSFNFNDNTVRVFAGYSKHRREDVQPLPVELASAIKEFFRGKMPAVNAFGGDYSMLTDRTANMIKADLKDAEIPYIDDNGVFDFHSLRHSFITNLRNVSGRVAQSLARHRSSAMTDRYTHVKLHDERAALDSLPDLSQPKKKTGTDKN